MPYSHMFRARVLASRKAWLNYQSNPCHATRARYERAVSYELRRNHTERYTPFWAVLP